MGQLVFQLGQPTLQKPPLRHLFSETEGSLVRGSGFLQSSQPTAEVRPGRMREVVIREIAAFHDGVDQREPRRRTIAHRHRHCAVQLNNGRRLRSRQQVVQRDDLAPVCSGSVGFASVHGCDSRLDRIGADPASRQRPLDQRQTLADLRPVPERTVLVVEQDQLPGRRRARRAARVVKQHQREKSQRFRLRQQFDEKPSQADRLIREIVPDERPWIERIEAWQIVGGIVGIAFLALVIGVIMLRWVRGGTR